MRLCKPGDTICTVTRYGEAGYLRETPQNCDAVDYANSLIRAGLWRVCRCGECGCVVEECQCVGVVGGNGPADC